MRSIMFEISISINKIFILPDILVIDPIKFCCIFYMISFIGFRFFQIYFICLYFSHLVSFIRFLVVNHLYPIYFIRFCVNLIYITIGTHFLPISKLLYHQLIYLRHFHLFSSLSCCVIPSSYMIFSIL